MAIPAESIEPHEDQGAEKFDKEISMTIRVRVKGRWESDGPMVERAWIGSEEMPHMLVMYINDEGIYELERQL